MAYPVTMPALGESVTEGTVTRWLKQVGDRVEVDEPLLEVSTDKVDTEIPSPVAGVLTQVLVGEDETVEVGAQLAVIGDQVPEGGPTGAGTPDGEGAQPTASAPEAAAAPAAPAQTVPVAAPVGPAAPAPVTPTPPTAPTPAAAAPAPSPAAAPAAPAAPSETGPGAPPQGAPQEGTTVTMPALGESVTEGTVTRWLKQVGDRVEVDEPLLEVSTDKVDTEIPSPTAGVLTQVLVGEDETVEVGAPLAVIGGGVGAGGGPAQAAPTTAGVPQPQPPAEPEAPLAEEASLQQQAATQSAAATTPPAPATAAAPAPAGPAAPAPAPPAAAPTPTPTPAPETPTTQPPEHAPASPPPGQVLAPSAPQTRQPVESGAPAPAAPAPTGAPSGGEPSPYVTPLVRRLAAEHGVDLSTVTGTGVGGRIRKQDVLAAAEAARTAPPAAPQPPTPQPATGAPAPGGPAAAAQPVSPLRGTRERMSRLRKLIATRMVESLQTAAQLTTVVEVDVTRIARLRARARDSFLAREGVKLSFLPFFAEATVEALKVHPKLNATIEDDEIVYPDAEHLGVAVDTERGLLVPVIKNAGDLNLAGLARKIADLAERTRTNRITPDELSGGTFTLTNTGSRGALFDTPIINQPQVGVLGTGTVVKRPVVIDDPDLGETIAVRSVVLLALTYDHRLVDGADAARFLTTIKNRLEEGAFEAELGL